MIYSGRFSSLFRLLLLLCAGMLATSCDSSETEQIPDVTDIEVSVEVTRLEQEMFAFKSVEDAEAFLNKHPQLAESYFYAKNYPNQRTLAETLLKFTQVKENDTLYQDTQRIFGDFETQRKELESAFQFVKYYFPEIQLPRIYTVVSGFSSFGFGQDVFVGNGYLVIGLDYFAGKDCTYRPSFPDYIVKRLTPQHLTASVMKLFSTVFNAYEADDKQMIADMIFYGKALYFTDKVMPFAPDSLIMGYDQQEIFEAQNNEAHIWKFFIEKDLLFKTENFTKTKFLGESPRIFDISERCPGRVGRFLGWQIVKSYARNHPIESLYTIMQEKNANIIFQQSKYRPAK